MAIKSPNKIIKTLPAKIPKRTFQITDPLFRQRIFVLLNQNQESYQKFLNKNGIKDVGTKDFNLNRMKGMSTWIDNKKTELRDYLILLKEFNWTIDHQGTLIHEIVHTVIKIWDSNNIPFNADTQEFLMKRLSQCTLRVEANGTGGGGTVCLRTINPIWEAKRTFTKHKSQDR